jgi:tetratricopeptide (TPR) repeat protein
MRGRKFFPLVVVAAGVLAYQNSFTVPFLFDDPAWVERNPRIRHAWAVKALSGTSRPVVQWSLALNYAAGSLDVRGYHAFNLAVHLLAALTLYGVVRRTFTAKRLRPRYGQGATGLALAVALLWLVHPLQTESVTYIIQRAESMMGLCYLLTLYCVIRGADSADGRLWYGAGVIACAAGMGTKPVMVTAPLMILLYDRAFLAGSFREALRQRTWLYSGLAATWALLPVWLAAGRGEWNASAGPAYPAVGPVEYALTQPGVILHYLRLSLWPHPLCLDYAWPIARTWADILPPLLVLAVLLGATVWAWKTDPAWGFWGAWFFLILAPSSSVIPIADAAVEHRMYLPLAAVVTLGVSGLHAVAGRRAGIVVAALAVALGYLTWRRNQDYRSELAIWQDTVARSPDNSRAHNNLGIALKQAGRVPEAIEHYEEALRTEPEYADAHYNLAIAWQQTGRLREAVAHYTESLRIKPDHAEAHNNLGNALARLGRPHEAIAHFEEALRLKPEYADAHLNLGLALADLGRIQEAIRHCEQALRIGPDNAEAHNDFGIVLQREGNLPEAIGQYERALGIKADYAEAHNNLGMVLWRIGRRPEAIGHYEQALRIKPDYAEAHNNLGIALAGLGRVPEAVGHWEQAVRINPDYAEAHYNLGVALEQAGKLNDAIAQYESALRLKPGFAKAQAGLARLQTAR